LDYSPSHGARGFVPLSRKPDDHRLNGSHPLTMRADLLNGHAAPAKRAALLLLHFCFALLVESGVNRECHVKIVIDLARRVNPPTSHPQK